MYHFRVLKNLTFQNSLCETMAAAGRKYVVRAQHKLNSIFVALDENELNVETFTKKGKIHIILSNFRLP